MSSVPPMTTASEPTPGPAQEDHSQMAPATAPTTEAPPGPPTPAPRRSGRTPKSTKLPDFVY